MSVAFAATASRPTAVLTSPCIAMDSTTAARKQQLADTCDMAEVSLQRHPLVATAGLVWNTDLPRPLQQILFDTADAIAQDNATTGAIAFPAAALAGSMVGMERAGTMTAGPGRIKEGKR